MVPRLASLIVATAILTLLSPTARAETLIVSKWGPPVYRVLQEALDAAAAGDTIRIEGGTFSETTTRFFDGKNREAVGWIDKPLTIIGTELAWLDGPEGLYNYCLLAAQSCQMEGVQIRNGGGTGVLFWSGESTIRHCLFQDLGDGIIGIHPGTTVSVYDSEFYRCKYKCIVAMAAAHADVLRCRFESRTDSGALPRATYTAYEGTIALQDSEFVRYGMVEVFGPGLAEISDCTARDLRVSALIAWNGGRIEASRCVVTGGDSIPGPIGMEVTSGGHVIADHCSFEDMTYAAYGSGSGTIEVHHSEIANWRLYSVLLTSFNSEPRTTFDFTNNWWGTTDSTAIAESIIDGNDDPVYNSHGYVESWPIRDTPLPAERSSFGSLKSMF